MAIRAVVQQGTNLELQGMLFTILRYRVAFCTHNMDTV